jgi:antitoxin PrlF
MKELLATVISKGQITIPVEVRRSLGLRQGDKVVFVIGDRQVVLRCTGSVVAATAGALHSARSPLSAKDLRVAAEAAIAEEATDRAWDGGK